MRRNILAADIHRFMCDHPGFGYSWAERWGGPATVDFDGVTLNVGDYDCSSSTITAWRKALEGTPYEGCLDAASYTGNMRSVFTRSGLFEWVGVDEAQRGDLYLNETNHVAMCQGDGELSEFSSSETGGIYGERGDQTGWESHVCDYYWYPWDGCLHYNGKADGTEEFMYPVIMTPAGAEVHRLYNSATGEHFFTADAAEKDALIAVGWTYEGVGWETSDAVPVYRMYKNGGKHLLTSSFDEADMLVKQGWRCESVPFFAASHGRPVHRLLNAANGDHMLTASDAEAESLKAAGWQYEGAAFLA